jgi:uroporphyrinogen-III synthase
MRLLVTRPEPDASREAEALSSRGHEVVVAPLLTIQFTGSVPLQFEGAQALIFTSRNALRALAEHPEKHEALQLPVFAVGETTTRAAQALGFADVTMGTGTASDLAELIRAELNPEKGPLVHLAGETLAFDLKGALEDRGFAVRQPVLYRAAPVEAFPEVGLRRIKAGSLDGVILMSPRTARTFAALLKAAGALTEAKSLVCYCLSEAVAEAVAPLGFAVRVARRPREDEVLALVDSKAASS